MEQECVAGLYQSLGKPLGEEISSGDVSLLYHKVFHSPSNADEAHTAMKRIAGDDSRWSCIDENIFDVLLEMERERERKDKLYWDLQLVNVGNRNDLCVMDNPVIMDPHMLNCKDPHTLQWANNSDTASLPSRTLGTDSLQTEKLKGRNDCCGSVKRLKKASRQCWIRLASEGVQTLLPSPQQGQNLRVKVQDWDCVSLSDVLLLVDVKYDVITHLLYTEMLQESYAPSVWATLLPWQRHKEEEGLEDLAEEALESGDMLLLADLPGAFRIYRACLVGTFRSCLESTEKSWSAVSLLYELHTSRQQEREKLTVVVEGLDRESLKLVCLYIMLATLRAQREKWSYAALLAARQSWEKWPHVNSPGRAELAALWLRGEDEEHNEGFISPQQQALLQLLVLAQEKEKRHLVRLVQGATLEDLQGPGYTVPPKDEGQKQTVLRNGCINRLRQMHTSLQKHNAFQAHTCSDPAMWSQHQLEVCGLLLLTRFLELQEVQTSSLLSVLMDKSAQHLQVLRQEYESELQTQSNKNLLQLLISDVPLTSVSMDNCSGTEELLAVVSVQAADETNKRDFCTDCGVIMEDMPYLEIVCVSDTPNKTLSLTAEGRIQEEEGKNSTKSPQAYEKQGSLIVHAWSKPQEEDNETHLQPSDTCATVEDAQSEEPPKESHDKALKPTLFQSDYTGHCDAQATQVILGERTLVDQPHKGEAIAESDLQTHAFDTETLRPHLFSDPPEMKPHSDEPCLGVTNEIADVGIDMELCPATSDLWDLPCLELTHSEEQKQATFTERESVRVSTLVERDPVSAMERENTIRNLVDMQRKVEQRQQRDRERQLLRVQERLSIIQNRKAEEDLLGLKHTDRLRHLTGDLPQEDKSQQKTVVRERLAQLRRERSYVLQSKRDRNTAGFKELLGPVALLSGETKEEGD